MAPDSLLCGPSQTVCLHTCLSPLQLRLDPATCPPPAEASSRNKAHPDHFQGVAFLQMRKQRPRKEHNLPRFNSKVTRFQPQAHLTQSPHPRLESKVKSLDSFFKKELFLTAFFLSFIHIPASDASSPRKQTHKQIVADLGWCFSRFNDQIRSPCGRH